MSIESTGLTDDEKKAGSTKVAIADDAVWGAANIAQECGLTERQTYWALERHHLPARKIGALWVASRRQLRAAIFGEETT
jgi:hypothetical protein